LGVTTTIKTHTTDYFSW